MTIQAVKGTRDFYPEQMRLRNYIIDTWRKVSLRNGFAEYDAPIFEFLDLFTIKSGDEIAEQLFHFTDRGGRDLALRPEITPSLARMVAAKINALPRPIKWFSVPRLCRAENPQRGRLREFFQWNIDMLGVADVIADAECIFTLVDFLREVDLRPEDIKVHVGSRPLVMNLLKSHGVDEAGMDQALLALDKRPKVSEEEFARLCGQAGLDDAAITAIGEFMDVPAGECLAYLKQFDELTEQREQLEQLHGLLTAMGAAEYVAFDWHIVRGLAYYTGVVYEALAEGERAVAGGGRYDRLLELVGGPACPATGFGMGDVVLGLLLEEKNLLPEGLLDGGVEVFAIDAAEGSFGAMLELVGQLRKAGIATEYSVKRQNVGKQMKAANRANARWVVLVEKPCQADPDSVTIKNMASGQQQSMSLAALQDNPRGYLPGEK